jgi:hypothetical protein
MRAIAKFLIRLYPANWRERYGEEFEALLDDSSPGLFSVFDLLKGALQMQLSIPAFPKLALVLSIAGLLSGLLLSFAVTPRYVSSAAMAFSAPPISSPTVGAHRDILEHFLQLQTEMLSRTSLSNIMQDPRLDLYKKERTNTPLEDVIEKMRADIQVTRDAPGSAAGDYLPFHVRFTYEDRVKANRTVQALITKFEDANLIRQRVPTYVKRQRSYDQIDRMEARIAALEKRLGMPLSPPALPNEWAPLEAGINLNVVDPPSLPIQQVYPDRSRFMAVGFAAGLAAAIFTAIVRRKRPPIPFPAQLA